MRPPPALQGSIDRERCRRLLPPDPAGKNFLYKAWRKIEDESSFNPTLFTDAAFLGKTVKVLVHFWTVS